MKSPNTQTEAKHPCDACGGTGLDPKRPTMGRIRSPQQLRVWQARQYCPVCLGAGVLPDQMPVADALADAETLREYQRDPFEPNFLIATFGLNKHVGECGALRCGIDRPLYDRHFYETEHAMVEDARFSARAAFRAVPGLRG